MVGTGWEICTVVRRKNEILVFKSKCRFCHLLQDFTLSASCKELGTHFTVAAYSSTSNKDDFGYRNRKFAKLSMVPEKSVCVRKPSQISFL